MKLFSLFICEELEGRDGYLRVDFSIQCAAPSPTGTGSVPTGAYLGMQTYAIVMVVVHVIGTPATYAYLFFIKHREALKALKDQEVQCLCPHARSVYRTCRVGDRDAFFDRACVWRAQLADYHKETLAGNAHITEKGKEALVTLDEHDRVDAKKVLPGYMRKLTGGYELRACPCSREPSPIPDSPTLSQHSLPHE